MAEIPAKTLLNGLKLGSPVAEHDTALATYFIETDTFNRLINDEGDIVAGDKGTGKTALFRILKDKFATYPALDSVEVLSAFNPSGTPVFQQLIDSGAASEAEYIGVWKAYILALAGNWLLELYGDARPSKLKELDDLLQKTRLRSRDYSPSSIFGQLAKRFKPKSVEVSATATAEGLPLFGSKFSFADDVVPSDPPVGVVRHDEALALLHQALEEAGFNLWLVFDRLDEAFQAHPNIERPALRALFRAYLDMQDLPRIKLKLFVRKDLFARIIEGGFVNLTHINARKISITWEDDDLYSLLFRRIAESGEFLNQMGLGGAEPDGVFAAVFPPKVDDTSKRPTTWNWLLTRIRDANDVKSPRNLVDLIGKAIEAQKRREAQDPRTIEPGTTPLLTGSAMKRALEELSRERVEDTLLAEAGDMAPFIQQFEQGKAEHNNDSLRTLFGDEAPAVTKRLVTLGFLEKVGQSYKVPSLYRQGLNITQGKAFSAEKSGDEVEEDD